MNAPDFKNRWLIRGKLTTLSELHIGDGEAGEIHQRSRPKNGEEEIDASTVCTDYRGTAYVPGSAIKGTLRALVIDPRTSKIAKAYESLLGSDSVEDNDAVGGKLEFWDLFHLSGQGTEQEQLDQKTLELDPDRKRPWWDHTRKTCVAVAVSLDRRTRCAKENLFYHVEYVPPGETFTLEISGENLEEEDIARLLALLDRFNSNEKRATLGALASDQWGQVEYKLEKICCFDRSDISGWKSGAAVGLAACKPVSAEVEARIKVKKNAVPSLLSNAERLIIDLHLLFDSPWLIRDARQGERSQEAKKKGLSEDKKPKDAVPIHDGNGYPFVPAKSLRGVLRSRAEMILRTLELQCADHPTGLTDISAKSGGDQNAALLDALSKISKTDLAARLFGLPGWRAPAEIPRLSLSKGAAAPVEHHQEFVAIDRFMEGAAPTAKFNAHLAGSTRLSGKINIDLVRLKKVDEKLASIGLLALVLRDLAEGDITIGAGAAKGQGDCTTDANVIENGVTYDSLTAWFQNSPLLEAGLDALRSSMPVKSPKPDSVKP